MNSTAMIAAAGLLAFAYIFWSSSPPTTDRLASFLDTLTKCGILVVAAIGLLADLGPAAEFFGGAPDLCSVLQQVALSGFWPGGMWHAIVACERYPLNWPHTTRHFLH